jgi:hypothetical protein
VNFRAVLRDEFGWHRQPEGRPIEHAVAGRAYGCWPATWPGRPLTIEKRGAIMRLVTMRETAQTLLDQVPDDELDAVVKFLACRGINGTDISAKAIRKRGGSRRLTKRQWKDFLAEHGPHMLTPDGEG